LPAVAGSERQWVDWVEKIETVDLRLAQVRDDDQRGDCSNASTQQNNDSNKDNNGSDVSGERG
jgi:hypothetical protein